MQLVTTQYMPNASLIRGEMAKVESALKGITCVGAFAAVIKRVNDTIIRVPPETDSIVGQLQARPPSSPDLLSPVCWPLELERVGRLLERSSIASVPVVRRTCGARC